MSDRTDAELREQLEKLLGWSPHSDPIGEDPFLSVLRSMPPREARPKAPAVSPVLEEMRRLRARAQKAVDHLYELKAPRQVGVVLAAVEILAIRDQLTLAIRAYQREGRQ